MSRGCGRRRPTDLRGTPLMSGLSSSSIPRASVALRPMAVSGARIRGVPWDVKPIESILRLPQAYLPQHPGMIPIDALTGEFVAAKLHDNNNIHGDFLVWGG